jgi:hypothetical protein
MSACELCSLHGPSPPRGRKQVQSSAGATSAKHTKTTTHSDNEEGSHEAKVEPQAVKRTPAKGKDVAKGKKKCVA